MSKENSPHQNPDFNIIQDLNPRRWLVIKGQRAPGGYPVGNFTVMKEMEDREDAIWLADMLQKMKEDQVCVYVPERDKLAARSIVIWDAEKRDLMVWGENCTVAEYIKNNPSTQLLTGRELHAIIEKEAITQPQLISEESYTRAFECLPPVHVHSSRDSVWYYAESFQMSERFVANVTGTYVKIGDECYAFKDIMGKPHAELVQKVKDSLPLQVRFEVNVTPQTLIQAPQKLLDLYAEQISSNLVSAYNDVKPVGSEFYPVVSIINDPANKSLWSIKAAREDMSLPDDVKQAALAALDNGLYNKLPSFSEWSKFIASSYQLSQLDVEPNASKLYPYFLTVDGNIHRLTPESGGIEGALADAGTSAELAAVLYFGEAHCPDDANDYQEEKELLLQAYESRDLVSEVYRDDRDAFSQSMAELAEGLSLKNGLRR